MSVFPPNNLPDGAKYWARDVEKRIINAETSFLNAEINNVSRDSQILSTANQALAAALEAQAAASAAATAAADAAAAAATANNAISRLETYQQINLGGGSTTTFSGSPTGTVATYSKSFTVSTTGGGSRAATIVATGTVDLGITSSDAQANVARVYVIQTLTVGGTTASTYTRVGSRKYVTTANSRISIYGGGSLTCAVAPALTSGSKTVTVTYSVQNDGTDTGATWSGEVTLDNISVGISS